MATVYALYCMGVTGVYVGCTKGKPAKRFREHRCLLKNGRHTCKPLQDAYSKSGTLLYRVLRECPDDLESRRAAELAEMEKIERDGYHLSSSVLFNEKNSFRPTDEAIRKGVANAHKEPGNRWTPEANEKRRQAQLGKPKGHGAKISATKRAKREQEMR